MNTNNAIIIATFENGNRGLIAKEVSDYSAWVVPGRKERHGVRIEAGKTYLVEIVGSAPSGNLRFCRVVKNVEDIFRDILVGKVSNEDILLRRGGAYINVALPGEMTAEVDIEDGSITELTVGTDGWSDAWSSQGEGFAVSPTLLARFEKMREAEEVKEATRQAALTEKFRAIMEMVQNDRENAIFGALQLQVAEALKDGASNYLTKEQEAPFEGLGGGRIDTIVRALTDGAVGASYYSCNGSGGYYLVAVERVDAKEVFLREHPEAGWPESDPKFWEKACKLAGKFLYQTEDHKGYGVYLHYNTYAIQVGGVTLRKSLDAGWSEDDEPRYL